MLVVIALTSAAVMRNSLNADMISQNTRRQAQAMQAAQTALGYCEGKARVDDPAIKATYVKPAVTPSKKEYWVEFAQWTAAAAAVTGDSPAPSNAGQVNVPSDILTSATIEANDPPRFAPQCMAQYRSVPGTTEQVVVVTARGFSNDYQEASGRTQAGSVVWLQSVLRLEK
ncbi:hypothetical protein [Aquabacterium sp.]|uniref:hypothetical protein n=1 Tax=Aquabacterium sp. TaxID=1872578 RepID=UPI0025C1F79F|nr:hypothetical protein [Aquabacterium sp.]